MSEGREEGWTYDVKKVGKGKRGVSGIRGGCGRGREGEGEGGERKGGRVALK